MAISLRLAGVNSRNGSTAIDGLVTTFPSEEPANRFQARIGPDATDAPGRREPLVLCVRGQFNRGCQGIGRRLAWPMASAVWPSARTGAVWPVTTSRRMT